LFELSFHITCTEPPPMSISCRLLGATVPPPLPTVMLIQGVAADATPPVSAYTR
jgi:hypothetical protein